MSADAVHPSASDSQQPSLWLLIRRSYSSFVSVLVVGSLLSVPVIQYSVTHRTRGYTETNYYVGDSPHEEARLSNWANSLPGIDKFVCERAGTNLWVRWEYRGLRQPEAVHNAPAHLRELGYEFRGMGGGSAGAVSRDVPGMVADVLTDPLALAAMLTCMQGAFGVAGILGIRRAKKRGQSLPPLFPRTDVRVWIGGVFVGAALFGFGFAYSWLLEHWMGHTAPSPWNGVRSMPHAARLFLLLFAVGAAPLAEEIFFRGYLFGQFSRSPYLWQGIVVSALLFAAAHFSDIYNTPAIFVYGVVFALLYHRTHSLASSVAAHATANALAVGMLFSS